MSGMVGGDGDALAQEFRDLLAAVDPVAAVAAADARRSIDAYPKLTPVGAMFTAAERTTAGWRVLLPLDPVPQGAREALADLLLAEARGPAAAAAAAELVDRRLDAVAVGARRLRVIRVEQVLRIGLDGPEPPRPTDPDRQARTGPETLPVPAPGGGVAAELDAQLLAAAARSGDAETHRALGAYPGLVFLRPAFAVSEHVCGRWRITSRSHDTPAAARSALAFYLRHLVPLVERPAAPDLLEYTAAADRVEEPARQAGVTVLGRRFRIVRIERTARMGPEGPEPPRLSDFDHR